MSTHCQPPSPGVLYGTLGVPIGIIVTCPRQGRLLRGTEKEYTAKYGGGEGTGMAESRLGVVRCGVLYLCAESKVAETER